MKDYTPLDFLHSWVDTKQGWPPKEPGVYCIYFSVSSIYGRNCELLYVGSSQNLSRRLKNHEQLRNITDKSEIRITYYVTPHYKHLEKLAIQRFAPLANIQYQDR